MTEHATSTARLRPLLLALLTLTLLVGSGVATSHAGHDDGPGDVPAEEDFPEGCTTATAEDQEGCGAMGRNHTGSGHLPPVEVCAERTTPAGATITRILPDGPRHADGTHAFRSGACVYLPPGYADDGLSYPVIYLLHGGGGDQGNWIQFGDLAGTMDRAIGADESQAAIVVMPDGRSGQWYDYEDGRYLIATYVFDHLVPWVDHHYRTIADRAGRAVVGLSNGGYGAVHFAAKRPDLFSVAGGMSSNIGARTLSGLGPDGGVHYQGSVPYQLASNLDEVDLILDLGTSCQSDLTRDACATIAIDLLFWPDHLAFAQRMQDVGHQGDFDYRETEGSHAWRWWSLWFETRDLPFVMERIERARPAADPMSPSAVPASFRYRSIAPQFEIWDHHVSVERDVREFLDLRDVTVDGFEIQGSGTATLTTAPRYVPGATYRAEGVAGAGTSVDVVADDEGRLTVVVDLGPSHTADQFTDEADLAEALGDYWTVRTVSLQKIADPPPTHPGRGHGPPHSVPDPPRRPVDPHA